jgi:glycosyltransferase involved in cell wall biosynthesis
MKLLFISDVVPGNTASTNPVLYRHLKNIGDNDLLVVSDGPVPGFNHVVLKHRFSSRIIKRVAKTRLKRWGLDFQEFFLPCNPDHLAKICENYKPDIILTVAHGGLWKLAMKEAHDRRIPLATIFHDWWPALSGTHDFIRPLLDKQFRALHQNSTVSLCVCEGMLQALGSRPKAEILYPIPSGCSPSMPHAERHPTGLGGLKIIYMGNLGDYGGMVQAALEATKEHPRIRLEVSGRSPAWPDLFKDEMRNRSLWHDFIPEEKLGSWLASADAFLVTMRFEPHFRRYMETSFPSKITHYAQFRKPIIIWGPDYCSAVSWARGHGSALCITDPSPAALVQTLEAVSASELNRLADASRQAAESDFCADLIQRQFLGTLDQAMKLKTVPGKDSKPV